MKRKDKFLNGVKITASFVLVIVAICCVCQRFPMCFTSQNPAALAAAAFTLTDGTYKLVDDKNSDDSPNDPTNPTTQTTPSEDVVSVAVKKERDKSGYYDSFAEHKGEAKYTVEEKTIGDSGTQVDNFYVKNRTGLDFDFTSYLLEPLTFDIEKNSDSPQVLIYHTHTSESYLDEDVDYFYESFYSRTQNIDFSVVSVGNIITESLNKRGIKTIHDTTVHDSSYNGAYDRSVQTVYSNMDEYKDIKVTLDIHRDALGTEENKVKPVFTYNGKKGAQIMILSGCDYYNKRGFVNWENNLNFALKLQNTAEKLYPGMTRPLSFGDFAYNEYVSDGSLLIEVGADANSIEEAEYTGALLADVIYEVLK